MKKCHHKTPEKLLLEAGHKLSEPRFLVLNFLRKSHGPLSAQEISQKIKLVNLASVYRSLNIFAELGIVNTEIIGMERRYCLASEAHHHISCLECGRLEKIKCNHSFEKIKNFTNVKHQLILKGICQKCADKKS